MFIQKQSLFVDNSMALPAERYCPVESDIMQLSVEDMMDIHNYGGFTQLAYRILFQLSRP